MNSKSILLITPGFAKDEEDTSCIPALQDFVLGLNQLCPEIKITIVSLHYPGEYKSYNWNGNSVYSIGANNCKFPKRLVHWRKMKKLIAQLHVNEPFDLIHSFWYDEVTFLTTGLAKKLRIPVYTTFMGQDAIGKNRYANRINIQSDYLIALSDFQKNKIKDHLSLDIQTVIPWGILPPSSAKSDERFDLINIGSFNSVKNQEEAIRIVAQVQKQFPSIKCAFIGCGPHLTEVKNQVIKLGLEDNISFKGHLDRKVVFGLLHQSTILLHSSNYESFGLIFSEAIATKTMIVSRAVGFAQEKKWWKLYHHEDEATSHILSLLRNPIFPQEQEIQEHHILHSVKEYLKIWGIKKAARETLRPSNQ